MVGNSKTEGRGQGRGVRYVIFQAVCCLSVVNHIRGSGHFKKSD